MKNNLLSEIRSFPKLVNPFSEDPKYKEIKYKYEKISYPTYSEDLSLEEAVELFCREYILVCKEMEKYFSKHVKIVQYEDMLNPKVKKEIISWCRKKLT